MLINSEYINFFFFWTISVVITHIWLNTDAIEEYFRLFKLKLPYQAEYEKVKLNHPEFSYTDFLACEFNNFFVRLITCYDCIVVWLNFGLFFIYANYLYLKSGTIYANPLILGLNIVLSWIICKYLEKKSE